MLTAFVEARRRGLVTVGLAGYDGGEMAMSADVQHCLVVPSDSVHRIQEIQASLGFALWEAVQARLGHGRWVNPTAPIARRGCSTASRLIAGDGPG